MSGKLERLDAQLKGWSRGVIHREKGASKTDLEQMTEALGCALPPSYAALMQRFDGADFQEEHLFSIGESLAYWNDFSRDLEPAYTDDPDWPDDEPAPDDLLPIATDPAGNWRCLDLDSSGGSWGSVVDWDRDRCEFSTIHHGVESWLIVTMRQLELQYDRKGRPRPLRGKSADARTREGLQIHLEEDPENACALRDMASWLAENRTPEEALFAFREAAQGRPTQGLNHYMHGRWAITLGRFDEARQALRRALAVPPSTNPRRDCFPPENVHATHILLAMLYDRVEQTRMARDHRRDANRIANHYQSIFSSGISGGWYVTDELDDLALSVLRRGEK